MRLQLKWSKTHRTPGGEVQTKQTPNEGLLAERAWSPEGGVTRGVPSKGDNKLTALQIDKSQCRFLTHECQSGPIGITKYK